MVRHCSQRENSAHLGVKGLSKVVASWVICNQKIDILYNHSYVGYVFLRQFFFILQFVKVLQQFVKISNFTSFFDLLEPIKMEQNKILQIVLGKT